MQGCSGGLLDPGSWRRSGGGQRGLASRLCNSAVCELGRLFFAPVQGIREVDPS